MIANLLPVMPRKPKVRNPLEDGRVAVNPFLQMPVGSDLPQHGGITGRLPVNPASFDPNHPDREQRFMGAIPLPTPVDSSNSTTTNYGFGREFETDTPAPVTPQNPAMASSQPAEKPEEWPLKYEVGHDPRKSKRENLQDQIAERKNRKFNDKWGFMDTLKGAGLGFLRAFSENSHLPFGERLMASLGGAGMGAVQGTVDPNTDEKWSNQNKIAQLYGMYDQESKMAETDAKVREAQLKAEGTGIENVNKRTGDFLRTATGDNHIDEMEAIALRQLTGLPYSANDWRKVIRIDDMGVPYIAREGEEAVRPDASRLINPAKVVRERKLGENTYSLPDTQAASVDATIQQNNADRQFRASQFQTQQETTAADKEYRDEKEYAGDVSGHGQRVRKAKAEYAAAKKRGDVFATQLEAVQKTRAELAAGGYDTTEIDKQIADIQSRKATAEGEMAGAQVIMNEPAPKKLIRPKNPKTSKGGRRYSKSNINRVIRQ